MKRLLYTIFMVFALMGCSAEREELPPVVVEDEPRAVSFFADDVAGYGETRAAGCGWTAGDRVGLYILDSKGTVLRANICYKVGATSTDRQRLELDESESGDVAYFYPEHGETYNYYAYFPYDEALGFEDVTSSIHISTDNTNDMIDNNLLHASKEGVSGSVNDINLIFSHKFTNVYVRKAADSDPNITLSSVRIAGLYVAGDFDVVKGEFTSVVKDDILLTPDAIDTTGQMHLLTIPMNNLGGVYFEFTGSVSGGESAKFYYTPKLAEWLAGVTHYIDITMKPLE